MFLCSRRSCLRAGSGSSTRAFGFQTPTHERWDAASNTRRRRLRSSLFHRGQVDAWRTYLHSTTPLSLNATSWMGTRAPSPCFTFGIKDRSFATGNDTYKTQPMRGISSRARGNHFSPGEGLEAPRHHSRLRCSTSHTTSCVSGGSTVIDGVRRERPLKQQVDSCKARRVGSVTVREHLVTEKICVLHMSSVSLVAQPKKRCFAL